MQTATLTSNAYPLIKHEGFLQGAGGIELSSGCIEGREDAHILHDSTDALRKTESAHGEFPTVTEMGIPDHLTCLLRNLDAGQEATVRRRHGTTDWSQIGKGARQVCILSPCLFDLHAGYIIRNARLDEAQPGIKIARRNINNLRYADDTTLMAESKELKSFLKKVREESEKVGLILNIPTTQIMTSGPITSWQIDGETLETVRDFIFLCSKINGDSDCSHKIKRHVLLGRRAMTNLDSILKSRDITLLTKVHIVKAIVLTIVM